MIAPETSHPKRSSVSRTELGHLLSELLDAHSDTVELARDLAPDERWQVHLGYLRDLEQVGQEMLWALLCGERG